LDELHGQTASAASVRLAAWGAGAAVLRRTASAAARKGAVPRRRAVSMKRSPAWRSLAVGVDQRLDDVGHLVGRERRADDLAGHGCAAQRAAVGAGHA
jgi:hypothetical protein